MTEYSMQSASVVVDPHKEVPIRVLHVDDDFGLLEIARQCLELEGSFIVDTAPSVEEAMKKLKEKAYDAVVSDYQMPGKDGLQFLKELRANRSSIPFIIFTGRGREEIAIEALNLGANQYLNKTGDPAPVYCELAHGIRQAVERNKAEERIRRSEEKYRNLFELAPDALVTLDMKGVITSCNAAALATSGYSRDEIVGKHFSKLSFLRIRDMPKYLELFASIVRGNVPKPVQVTWHSKDGASFVSDFHVGPVKEDGRTVGFQVTARDITERKKAEEALRQSEERYRDLFENAKDVIVLCDLKANVTHVNKAAEEYGFNKSEILGKNIRNFVFKRYWPQLLKDVAEVVLGKKVEGKIEIRTPKGDKMAEYRSNPIFSDDRVVGIQTILEDITERRDAEESVRESQEKLRSMLDATVDGIAYVDTSGKLLAANERLMEMMGYGMNEIVGKNIAELKGIDPEDLPRIMKVMERAIATGEPAKDFEVTLLRKDGSKIHTEIGAGIVRKEGKVAGFTTFIKDISERKKAENALRESEEKYRDLFENAMDAIATIDLKGTITTVNNQILRYGYKKEELVGKNILDFVSKEFWSAVMKDFSKATQGESAKNETELINPTGKILVEYHAGPIIKENNVVGVQISLRNMTERKKTEEELRESEERYRNLFESIQDPVAIFVGREGRLIDYNAAFKKSSGYTDEELRGKTFLDFVYPDDQSIVLEKYQTDFSEKEFPLVYEIRGLNKKGESIPLEVSVSTYKKKGRIIGVEVIHRNITDRKRAERTALENQQNFKALFTGNPEAAVHVGPDFCILDINSRFEDLFGYKLDEIKGRNINEVVVPRDKTDEAQMLDCRAKQDKHVSQDTVRRKKDGSLVPVFVSAAPITIEGRFLGYVAVYKDISELKNTQKKLETMNEKLRVTGGLTRHDVRNKLSIITGNVHLLKRQLADNATILDKLRDIETAVQQTTRIFDFAKAYEMLGAEEPRFIEVAKTLDEAVSFFSNLINVKIANECFGLAVLADSLLRQMFYNLIDNSLKYGKKISRIRVYYERANEDQLKLVYEDDGVGIPVAEKPKLFKEGYSTGGSTGYGLYLIKKITEVYGWAIQETGTPGRGAQFTITIPQASEHTRL